MRPSLKPLAIEIGGRLLRGYIRYAPVRAGKEQVWELYDQRFGWRTEPKLATTPFGFKVRVRLPDHIQKVIWLTGRWEPVITELVRSTLAAGDTFVDVGANIGYYSLLAARIVGRTGHVYAIEASPTICALLRENVALNHATNVEIVNCMVADQEGEREFWLAWTRNLGLSTSVESRARSRGMRSEGRVRCQLLTSLVPSEQLLNARLIKIDVEGAERAVLEPLFERLPEFSRRTLWAVELSAEHCPGGQADVERIFAAFSNAGYSAFALRNDYSLPMYLSRPRSVEMIRLTATPSIQSDVLFAREPSGQSGRA